MCPLCTVCGPEKCKSFTARTSCNFVVKSLKRGSITDPIFEAWPLLKAKWEKCYTEITDWPKHTKHSTGRPSSTAHVDTVHLHLSSLGQCLTHFSASEEVFWDLLCTPNTVSVDILKAVTSKQHSQPIYSNSRSGEDNGKRLIRA